MQSNLKFNNAFCPLLFLHQYVNTRKESVVCCYSDVDGVLHDLDFNSLEYKEIRNKSLGNEWPAQCVSCQKLELANIISPRQKAIKDFSRDHSDLVEQQVLLHLKNENLKPYSYDLRISNLCNLTCQMCNETNSSSIAKKNNKDDPFLTYELDMDINPNAVRIYLAGGEPFLIKKFVTFLQRITNLDCEIIVNTNGTIVKTPLLDELTRFYNVNITLSLDGFEDLNSKIRQGSIWEDIVENIHIFNERNFSIHVTTTLQKNNINSLFELGKFLEEKNIPLWTISELIEPIEFHWAKADVDRDQIKRLMELSIVKTNPVTMSLLNKITT